MDAQDTLDLAEKEFLLDLGGWTLDTYAATLTPQEFSIQETAERWEADLQGEKVVYTYLEQNAQLEIGLLKLDWTDLQLSRWLDKECRQADVTQPVLLEFCRKIIADLTTTRGGSRCKARFPCPIRRINRRPLSRVLGSSGCSWSRQKRAFSHGPLEGNQYSSDAVDGMMLILNGRPSKKQ